MGSKPLILAVALALGATTSFAQTPSGTGAGTTSGARAGTTTTGTSTFNGAANLNTVPSSTTVVTTPSQNVVGGGGMAGAAVTSSAPLIGGGTAVVVASSAQAMLDAVSAALSHASSLNGAVLQVVVNDGVVSLSGIARDRAQADHARDVAAGAAGTSRVNTSIKVA